MDVTTEKIKKIKKKTLNSCQKCRKASINVQLQQLTKCMRILLYFRDIFMRTILPTGGVYRNESSIVNLDNAGISGTGWYAKWGDHTV